MKSPRIKTLELYADSGYVSHRVSKIKLIITSEDGENMTSTTMPVMDHDMHFGAQNLPSQFGPHTWSLDKAFQVVGGFFVFSRAKNTRKMHRDVSRQRGG